MSAILSADDLNDFISPGVACIKPVETLPAASEHPKGSELEHEVVLDGQQSTPIAGAPAQISLTDCLACSGCVTSAEAVLVSLQSHSELLNTLDQAPALQIRRDDVDGTIKVEGLENPDSKLFVASVSPQTRASLAAAAGPGVSQRDTGRMITQLLEGRDGLRVGGKWNNGFSWVADTNAARAACLVLGAEEAISDRKVAKPILSSSCPGWVCYAEKTHPYVLPHISKIKSPQALMGTLFKTSLSRTLGISPDRIWHLAIMPCFDKKLEASREELTDLVWNEKDRPGRGVRDVDCVITSKEILMLAESRGIDFFSLPKESIPVLSRVPFPDPTIQEFIFPSSQSIQAVPAAGTSGGNLYYTLQYVASRHPGSRIETTKGRNVDVAEFSVISGSGDPIFRAARYYGFRNIQNLVRKLKPARPSRMPGARSVGAARKAAGKPAGSEYDYVEVMACPGGCTNGGGQIKVDDPLVVERKGAGFQPGPQEQKQWLAEVDEAYFSADESESGSGEGTENIGRGKDDLIGDISSTYIRDNLAHWSSITSIDIDRLVSTSYREVVSDVGKSKTNDTERVIQLAGKIGGGW
ncbi:iron only hydrogenase large subunit domain-containing protein [Hypoxylon argillaceum]|nr:iron only hydrogenase large subunit domain-containing protein [Hypoxylon argillaceum]KAI1154839.1 iron only hydrogenase large subunit domain-containing protein [Nemania diffusa]